MPEGPTPGSSPPPEPPVGPPAAHAKVTRVLWLVFEFVALLCLTVLALVGALVLHLGHPRSRRLVADVVGRLASSSLRGQLEFEGIDALGPRTLSLRKVRVRDPQRRTVLEVDQVQANFSLIPLARGFLGIGPAPTIETIALANVVVTLFPGSGAAPGVRPEPGSPPATLPSLVEAFQPKVPATTPQGPSTFRLVLRQIDITSLHVAGELGGVRTGDHDLRIEEGGFGGDLQGASLSIAPDKMDVSVRRLNLDVAAIEPYLHAPAHLELRTALSLPQTHPQSNDFGLQVRDLHAEVDSAGVHAILDSSISEVGQLAAELRTSEITPRMLTRLVGRELPLYASVRTKASVQGTLDQLTLALEGHVGGGTVGVQSRIAARALSVGDDHPDLVDAHVHIDGLAARSFSAAAPDLLVAAELVGHLRRREGTTTFELQSNPPPERWRKLPNDSPKVLRLAPTATTTITAEGAVSTRGHMALLLGDTRGGVTFSRALDGVAHAEVELSVPALETLLDQLSVERAPRSTRPVLGDVGATIVADMTHDQRLSLHATVRGHALETPLGTAGRLFAPEVMVRAEASGALTSPRFALTVEMPRVERAGGSQDSAGWPRTLQGVVVTAQGTPQSMQVSASLATERGQHLALRTGVVPTPEGARIEGFSGRWVQHHAQRADYAVDLGFASLQTSPERLTLHGLKVDSPSGSLRGQLEVGLRSKQLRLDLDSTPFDLSALAEGLALPLQGMKGTVALSAHLHTMSRSAHRALLAEPGPGLLGVDPTSREAASATRGLPTSRPRRAVEEDPLIGQLAIELHDVATADLGPMRGRIDVSVEERLVGANVSLNATGIGKVSLQSDVMTPSGPAELSTVAQSTTRLRLAELQVDLAGLALALERLRGPLPLVLAGTLEMRGNIAAGPFPDLAASLSGRREAPLLGSFFARTKGLNIATLPAEPAGLEMPSQPTRTDPTVRPTPLLQDVDLQLQAHFGEAAESGIASIRWPIEVVAEALDRRGPLAFVHVGGGSEGHGLEQVLAAIADPEKLKRLPLTGTLIAAPRSISTWPAVVASRVPIDAVVGFSATLDGTLGRPRAHLRSAAWGARGRRMDHLLTVDGTFEDGHGKASVTLTERTWRTQAPGNKTMLQAEVTAAVPADRSPVTWTVDANIEHVPLTLAAMMTTKPLQGAVVGQVHARGTGLSSELEARADVEVQGMRFGTASFDQARANLLIHAGSAHAEAHIAGTHGRVDVQVELPRLDDSKRLATRVDVDALNLELLSDGLIPGVDELGGRLTAHLASTPANPSAAPSAPTRSMADFFPAGDVRLEGGAITLAQTGERWENIAADVRLGAHQLELKSLHLEGDTGGSAEAHGTVGFDGFMPSKMDLELNTKRFPLANEGIRIGLLSGQVKARGQTQGEKMSIAVDISPMTIDLSENAGRDPQSLQPEESIVVLQPLAKPRTATRKSEADSTAAAASGDTTAAAQTLEVVVKLPDNVWIRRDDLNVAIRGQASATQDAAGVMRTAGRLESERGYVEALGKRFEIDHVYVTLDGSAKVDPLLDIATKWTAPDGTEVTLAVTGRVSQPRVQFKSNPPLSQAEIVSLLALGRRDAGSATQQQQANAKAADTAAAAVQGLTGAIVSKQLQRALPTNLSLSFQPGTKGFADARYATGYQHEKVYIELAYRAGQPVKVGSTLSQQTMPRTTVLVEYRFHPAWALMTTVGDTGMTVVDLFWQHRY